MTGEQAREVLIRGDKLRMVVGDEPGDPTLIIYLEDGMVISESVEGWSAGVVEPVCELNSDFLHSFLRNYHSLEVI